MNLRKNEPQIISIVNDFLREEAEKNGASFFDAGLGRQDVGTGGDWIYRRDGRFSIVEYKDGEKGYLTEGQKPRRERLCQLLPLNSDLRNIHVRCHLLVWGTETSVMANIYANQVCNKMVFQSLEIESPDLSTIMGPDRLAKLLTSSDEDFGAPLNSFQRYLKWLLMDTSDSRKSDVQLIARDRRAPGLMIKRFDTLKDLNNWIESQISLNQAAKPSSQIAQTLENADSQDHCPRPKP